MKLLQSKTSPTTSTNARANSNPKCGKKTSWPTPTRIERVGSAPPLKKQPDTNKTSQLSMKGAPAGAHQPKKRPCTSKTTNLKVRQYRQRLDGHAFVPPAAPTDHHRGNPPLKESNPHPVRQ